jgi:hypothetical protein
MEGQGPRENVAYAGQAPSLPLGRSEIRVRADELATTLGLAEVKINFA